MKDFLYFIMEIIAGIHNKLLSLNNTYELYLDDKALHFIIIGIVGMFLISVIYPIFKYLAYRDRIMTITWIYVFTLILVLTFAIEIGQGISGTGVMDVADIGYGILGFLVMYLIFSVIRMIVHWIIELFRR